MSSTLLTEQTRQLHSDVEQSVKSIVYEIKHKSKTQKHIVYQNHRINHHLSQLQQKSEQLLTKCYGQPTTIEEQDDNNNTTFQNNTIEMLSIKSQLTDTTMSKIFSNFETRLAEIREYHKKFPNLKIERNLNSDTSTDDAFQRKIKQNLQPRIESEVLFSTEEFYGRYVDLNSNYHEYLDLMMISLSSSNNNNVNLLLDNNEIKKIDYLEYLNIFNNFNEINLNLKKKMNYKTYLENLLNYFIDFMNRTQPLIDINKSLNDFEIDFNRKWNEGLVESTFWSDILSNVNNKDNNHHLNKGNNDTEDKKKKKKRRGRKSHKVENLLPLYKTIALLEFKIEKIISDWLTDVIEQTRKYIEKKLSRTWHENMVELERMEEEMNREEDSSNALEGEEQEEDILTKYTSKKNNPLNLPIGPDGKPIPYWLYKLNGLGNEYVCEICGNHSYWGHKAFEKHFQEWRHSNGMKCLGIPNTRHFHHITKINDAIELWKKIQSQENAFQWNQNEMEEVEDEQGNVYSKQDYEDLKKQGYFKK
ncbi:hypothetical protein ABK040_006080 [Willaertia magna]